MNDTKDRQTNVCLHLNYHYFLQVLTKTGMGLTKLKENS